MSQVTSEDWEIIRKSAEAYEFSQGPLPLMNERFLRSQAALQAELAAFRRETAERLERIEAIHREQCQLLAALLDAINRKLESPVA